jgi:hypothetical protein
MRQIIYEKERGVGDRYESIEKKLEDVVILEDDEQKYDDKEFDDRLERFYETLKRYAVEKNFPYYGIISDGPTKPKLSIFENIPIKSTSGLKMGTGVLNVAKLQEILGQLIPLTKINIPDTDKPKKADYYAKHIIEQLRELGLVISEKDNKTLKTMKSRVSKKI